MEAPCPQPTSATRAPATQLLLDPVEGRDPRAGQVVQVPGPEEPLAAAQHVRVLGAPREAVAGAEPLGDRVRGVHRSEGDLERPDDAGRAGLVGERHGVLVRQGEPAVPLVGHVPTGGLGAQPLADVALRGAGARREFRGGQGSGAGHRAVEAELVADDDHRAAEQGADVLDRLADELHEPGVVHVCSFPAHLGAGMPQRQAVRRWVRRDRSVRCVARPCGSVVRRCRVADSTPRLETINGVR